MTQYLPPNLLVLFAPREPLPYLPPTRKLPYERKTHGYEGVADYLQYFEDTKEVPAPIKVESKEEKRERKRKEKAEKIAYKLEQGIALYDPQSNAEPGSDAYKTLFVSRINYDTSESKLRREFETYGPIKRVTMIHDRVTGKPRGYAFIEYEHERDMHAAYKYADGKKIDGRRVLVDVERGRTVKGWLPRRLGGGLGGTRRDRNVTEESNGRERREFSEDRENRRRDYRENDRERRKDRKRSSSRSRDDRESRRYRERDNDRDRKRRKISRSRSRD